ncbi:phosphatase PAP2 family protein [Piscinibacter sp. XHJ-5]|uniref:phosphatase PAP2 family protein n=1 Tax=Piscinibacter sp. XHJ-5 TaxID=3037797 RepID=UPI0024536C87|nr:phosphatase PAP2 family protein [Piscinibacter sp. XHJ-5]
MTAARDARIAAVAGGLLVLWDASGWDLAVVRWFGDAQGFAWRDAWFTSGLLHEGGRVLAWLVLALLALDAQRALIAGPSRSERRHWLLVSLACLVLIPALKRFSHTSCPWDLVEFGGVAAHVPHWWIGVRDGGPGHCFPSGHAVAAFGFLPGYFLWREARPRLARAWLAGVCLAGLLFGAAQLVRGAHYPSHSLWSAWLCWVMCTAVARGRLTARTAPGSATGSPAPRRSAPAAPTP